jgi:uncharacterized membrane protein
MVWHSLFVSIHAATAILGLGPILAIGLAGALPLEPSAVIRLARPVLRLVGVSLVLMLLSGLALAWLDGWAPARQGWFHASLALYLGLGALHGVAMGATRGQASEADGSARVARLRKSSWAMSAVVGLLAILMTVRPG